MDLREYGLSYFCEVTGINPIGKYEIERIKARDLLLPRRIDLMAKIKYVEAHETGKGIKFANELYRRNIEACTMGMFSEMGDKNKQSYKDFINSFDTLISSIKRGG